MHVTQSIPLVAALAAAGLTGRFVHRAPVRSRPGPALAAVGCWILSLLGLTLASPLRGFALSLLYAAWSLVGIGFVAAWQWRRTLDPSWRGQAVGPVGTMARLGLGCGLVASVVHGQLATHLVPDAWLLGLVCFPGLTLAWHVWRIHRDPTPFRDTTWRSFVLSVALPIALYLTWWYAPALTVTSDAILIFVGLSMVLAALLNYAGCEMLASSNWLLHRHDQLACAFFTPIDAREQHRLPAV